MKTKLTSILLLVAIIFSCKKEQQSNTKLLDSQIADTAKTLSLSEVKTFYNKTVPPLSNFARSTVTGSNNATQKFDLSSLTFSWDKIQSVNAKKGNYWVAYVGGQPVFKNVAQGYRKLAFIRDSVGKVQIRILEIIPDVLYIQRTQKANPADFTGRIFIYDQSYHLLSGQVFGKGKLIGSIKAGKVSQSQDSTATSQYHSAINDDVTITSDCEWNQSSYINGDGELTIYDEQDCIYSFISDDSTTGGDFSGSAGDAGGGGGDASSSPVPSNLPDENKGAVDPKAMMDCFGVVTDPNAKMTVTVYVQEPWPGTSFDVGPNSVGHVAIGLSESSGSTSITQVVGFYPNATGYSKLHAPSKIVDNGGDLNYNVSISYTVTASQFNQITNYVANPPATYDLNTFNCTNFVYSACQAGGITLPDPVGVVGLNGATMTMETAMTPAHLGSSIQDLQGQGNVNTSGGYTPYSKGPCN